MIRRDATGIGLRLPHVTPLLDAPEVPAGLDFLEVIVENHLGASDIPRRRLQRLAQRLPVVGHGVSLNLLGAEPLDLEHLRRLRGLIEAYQLPWFSDHLCWSASGGHQHHDLLPAPYVPDLVPYAAARAAFVQDFLGVPLGIENLSSYLSWRRPGCLSEWEFYRQVVEQSGAWYMLDLNNIYVSSKNHHFDPQVYLRSVRWDRVLQVHLAGHLVRPDGLLHDTHDRAIVPEVWSLYRDAWRMGGPFPTLVEWDDQIPPLDTLLAVLHQARAVRSEEPGP